MSNKYLKFTLKKFDTNIEKILKEEEICVNYLYFLYKFDLFEDEDFNPNDLIKEYFKEKFIYNRIENAEKVLFQIFKNFDITQIICQNLYGYKDIKKENINHLLEFYGIFLNEDILSSYLMIFNKLNFISYNKKLGIIKILYNSFEENEKDFKLPNITLLNPEKPYTNRLMLRKYVREAEGQILWFDKYLDKRVFEILLLELDSNKVEEIKLLTTNSQHINNDFKNDYLLLKQEFANKNISLKCNIIDNMVGKNIHDRWFISKKGAFNFPSFQSFFKGQFAEIKKTNNNIEFNVWWINSVELS